MGKLFKISQKTLNLPAEQDPLCPQCDLLKAGVYDWEKPNDRLHQATQAIRHSTAIHMRMLAKHMQLQDKVIDHFVPFCGDKLTNTIEG